MSIFYAVLFLAVIGILIFATKKVTSKFIQLSYQNKLLRALRRLDVAALSTTELEPLCYEIVNAMHEELGFIFAVVALVDAQDQVIRRVAISKSPETEKAFREIIPVKFKDQILPFSETKNLFNQVRIQNKSMYTTKLYDVQVGILPEEVSRKIQQTFNIKGIHIYPLGRKDDVIGILEYTSTKRKEQLSKFEFTVMDEFTGDASRVLENVLLYEHLRKTSKLLVQANEKLKELDQLKDDFVSIVSHELRTPMTAIRSYAWMALHKSDVPLSDKVERYLVRTLMSAERLINLVNDMLNISRIEGGRIEINPEAVDLIKLTNDVVDEAYYSKGIEKKIHFSILEERIPKVLADPEKLREVMLNLLGNAVKFVPEEGKITISFFTDGKFVETSIKDSGPGISKEDLGKLFTKFGRLDNTYTALSTSGGTGLGLYIAKSLVELMHGRIWAASEGLGKGTTFTFSLPVAI